jgi:glucose/arabinose dehydrogenase
MTSTASTRTAPGSARPARRAFRAWLAVAALASCYGMRGSAGGAETAAPEAPRAVDARDVAVPAGWTIEAVAQGLTFPTGIAFDEAGTPHVVESGYAYGEVWTTPRLLRVEDGGVLRELARGARNGPWTGVDHHDGAFFVAEGGVLEGGRILRITPAGETTVLVAGLPSQGDHHTNGPLVGPDGWLYFGQGTATNSGVVGPDNAQFGWLGRHPRVHDVPGQTIRLRGARFTSSDVRAGARPAPAVETEGGQAVTGAFAPFGTGAGEQVVEGRVPCNGAVMRLRPQGGPLELVAWGFRNPFGLAFDPAGRLFVTDNGYDDRGSRPVWGTGDLLWRVHAGLWHGWPDFSGDRPLTDEEFQPPGKGKVEPLLAEHPNPPPPPAAVFPVHCSANGLDFSRAAAFGHVGQAFVALFGDETPATGKLLAPVGFKVVRVDVATGEIQDFAVNRGDANGPASKLGTRGLERPVAVRFDPSGRALWVVDFGVLRHGDAGARPVRRTGVLWRIARAGASEGGP